MRDPKAEPHARLDAAKAAAPYVHPRLSAVAVSKVDRLSNATLEELEREAIRVGKEIGLGDLTPLFAATHH